MIQPMEEGKRLSALPSPIMVPPLQRRPEQFVTVPAFETLNMNWKVKDFWKILELSESLRNGKLAQRVELEFETKSEVIMNSTMSIPY
jgi:hypothetical protein